MDENCVFRISDKEWMGANQNEQGIIAGAKCGLDKYVELIDKLKDLGVYENTTIIFLSDHGKPVAYYPNSPPPHNLKINEHPEYGFDRYQPFLMIKPAGSQQ